MRVISHPFPVENKANNHAQVSNNKCVVGDLRASRLLLHTLTPIYNPGTVRVICDLKRSPMRIISSLIGLNFSRKLMYSVGQLPCQRNSRRSIEHWWRRPELNRLPRKAILCHRFFASAFTRFGHHAGHSFSSPVEPLRPRYLPAIAYKKITRHKSQNLSSSHR